jgi:hypothetical protein
VGQGKRRRTSPHIDAFAQALSGLTTAEVLRQHKYSTAGFSENFNISRKFGFHQGFGTWRLKTGSLRQTGEEMARFDESIFSWLDRQRRKPFFLYVHFTGRQAGVAAQLKYRTEKFLLFPLCCDT